MMHQIGS